MKKNKVRLINEGKPTIIEEGIAELCAEAHEKGLMSATMDVREAVHATDVSFIVVGTPSSKEGHLNLNYIYKVAEQIGAALAHKSSITNDQSPIGGTLRHIVAIRSTVLPGTNEKVGEIIVQASGLVRGKDFIMAKIPHLQHFVTDDLEAVCRESDVLVVTNKEAEFADVLGEDTGGTLSNVLEELEQCGFIRAYNAIGKAKKDTMFQLIDNYTLFYFQFILENKQGDGAFWSRSFLKPVYNSWSGLAFERVCMQHLPQIKASLGIAGVGASACSWTYRPVVNGEQGAQIDMLINRDDQVIDICEMKFSHDRYTIKKELDEAMRRRRNLFIEKTETRKAVRIVLVTTYGVVDNPYAGNVHNVVTMEDLFRE